MPADVLSNSLGFASSGNDQSLKTGILNKNQLFNSDQMADFDLQLDQEITKSRQVQRRQDTNSSQHQDPSTSTHAASAETNPRKSGNDLPRRQDDRSSNTGRQSRTDNDKPRTVDNRAEATPKKDNHNGSTQTSNSEKPSKREKDVVESRIVEHTQQAVADEKAGAEELDYSKDLDLKQTNESFTLEAQGLDAQVEKAALIESQLLEQRMNGEVAEDGKAISAQQLIDKTLNVQPKDRSEIVSKSSEEIDVGEGIKADNGIDVSQLLRETVLSQDIKGVISEAPESKDGAKELSIEQRLRALLGDAGIKAVPTTSNKEIEVEDTDLDLKPKLEDIDPELKLKLEDVASEIELSEEEAVIIANTLKEKGLLTADGKVDLSKPDAAKQVLSQLVTIKSAKEMVLGEKVAFTAEEAESLGDESEFSSDFEPVLKVGDKLSGKNANKQGELELGDLSNPLKGTIKNSESILQQRLNGAIEQIKASAAEVSKSDSGSTAKVTQTNVTANVVGMGKPSEALGSQQATPKSFSMTMQNHFSKPSWGPELGQRLMMMVGQKIQVAEIRLDPPDMGPMEVKIRMNQEQANVVFNTQHAAVKDALEQAMPKLKEMLEQNGLSLGDVDVKDQSAQQKDEQDIDENGDGLLAGDTEADGDASEKESTTVVQSDRLVDYYA